MKNYVRLTILALILPCIAFVAFVGIRCWQRYSILNRIPSWSKVWPNHLVKSIEIGEENSGPLTEFGYGSMLIGPQENLNGYSTESRLAIEIEKPPGVSMVFMPPAITAPQTVGAPLSKGSVFLDYSSVKNLFLITRPSIFKIISMPDKEFKAFVRNLAFRGMMQLENEAGAVFISQKYWNGVLVQNESGNLLIMHLWPRNSHWYIAVRFQSKKNNLIDVKDVCRVLACYKFDYVNDQQTLEEFKKAGGEMAAQTTETKTPAKPRMRVRIFDAGKD